jgi:hypothetical protein
MSQKRISGILKYKNPQGKVVNTSNNTTDKDVMVKEEEEEDFNVALRRVQQEGGNKSKDLRKRCQIVERLIESLQTEMEESLFFHELGDVDDDVDEADPFDETKRNDTPSSSYNNNNFSSNLEYTAAALTKAEEMNKTLTNEIKVCGCCCGISKTNPYYLFFCFCS